MLSEIRGYPLRVFGICLVAYSCAQMDLALFGYAIPFIREEFGLTLSGVMSIVSSAFLLGGGLLVVLGVLGDRIGRLRMFQFSVLTSSLLVALHSIVPNPFSLVLLRGASIATGGLSYPITGAIITEEFPAHGRGLFMGLLQIGYPLGWAIASLWAMWILPIYGWRALFLVGLLSLPLILVVSKWVREPPRYKAAKDQLSPRPIRELFSASMRHRTIILFSAQFLFVWAYSASIFLFPSYLREFRGMEAFDFALVIGAGNAIGILGYILAAWVGEYLLSRRNTVVIWTVIGAVLFELMIWTTESFWEILAVYSFMSMFFYGSAAVKFAYLAEVFPTYIRSTAMTFCGSGAVVLGSAAGPYCVSLAVEQWGWTLGYATLVGVPLLMAGLLYLALMPIPSGLEVEDIQNYFNR